VNCKLFGAYPTLIDGGNICLLEVFTSNNRMNKKDENLSELELNSFWYKLHKKNIFVSEWIWLYFSQFLTVFDEPKIKLKVIKVVKRLRNSRDRLTGCNRFKPVFERF
jgi:hypothetical protein